MPNPEDSWTPERRLLALIVAGLGVIATAQVVHTGLTQPSRAERVAAEQTPMRLGFAACNDNGGDTGRPFVVAQERRVAPAVLRGDWSEADPIATPDADVRAALAAHYLKIAAAEHASVASFHRVALELVHLGAPPELLLDTHAAASDEVRHARTAYGIAAAFGAEVSGPGPLDVRGALDVDLSPAGIMGRLVDEACVGETVSALELRHAASAVADPLLAAQLREIAEDEERHAALAWRTLRWLLEAHPELRADARARVEAQLHAPPLSRGDALAPWGILSGEALVAVRQRAFTGVILPAVAALGVGR